MKEDSMPHALLSSITCPHGRVSCTFASLTAGPALSLGSSGGLYLVCGHYEAALWLLGASLVNHRPVSSQQSSNMRLFSFLTCVLRSIMTNSQ